MCGSDDQTLRGSTSANHYSNAQPTTDGVRGGQSADSDHKKKPTRLLASNKQRRRFANR